MKNKIIILFVLLGFAGWGCSANKSLTRGSQTEDLQGRWELSYMEGAATNSTRTPFIAFDLAAMRVSGNTGCNSFSGPLKANNDSIDFNQPFILTKMFCEGGGEERFLGTLERVTRFRVSDGTTLEFYSGDEVVMRFLKRQ